MQALLEDLRRARAGRPIAARPATLSYRVTRFVRRNRPLTAAALLVLVLAVGYVVTVVVQSRHIADERDRAEVERARAVQVADVLAGLFASGDPLARERPDTLRVAVVLDRAADRVREQLADQPLVLAQLLTVLSRVQFNLSRYPDALGLAEEAVSIRSQQGAARDADLAESLTQLGIALQQANRPADAETAYRGALAIRDSLGAPAGQRAKLLVNVAGSLQDQLRFDSAAALYDRAVELTRLETTVDTAALADLLNQQARLAMRMGNDVRATELTGQIVDLQRAMLGPGHPRLAFDLVNYGAMLVRTGQDSAAEPVLREAIDIAERTVGPDDRIAMEAKQVLGNALARLGRAVEGERLLAEAVEGKRVLLGPAHPQFASALSTHAEVLAGLGRMEEAIARFREASEIARNAGDMRGAGIYRERLGRSRCQAGDTEQALLDFSESIGTLEEVFPASSPFVVAAHRDLGNCYTRLRDWPAAEAELLKAYASAEAGTPAGRTEAMRSAQGLVTLYEAMGQPEKAGAYRAAADSLGRAGDPR